ncbi:MAG: hypothetical protein H8E14_09295 [Candidatus Marinimicrobia bacterium]|nr:hypothetical protein [Candidatus Neomarinimicrobiota bacterium]
MKKVFDLGVFDTSKRRMVEGDIVKQIKDYHIHLSTFRQEIDFWFSLLEKTDQFEKRYFRKPICIELFEYAQFLKKIKNLINKASSKINQVYEKKDRQPQVKILDKGLNKTLNDISEHLRKPRSTFAAHRYTDKKGEFLTMNDVISQINKLSDDNLNEKKHKLYECHNSISSWINKYETHLILLKNDSY